MTGRHIAIVGGGFSGTMLAARIAEAGMASTIIDRGARFWPGRRLFDAVRRRHLLNVRSSRMSAVEGRPGDFVDLAESALFPNGPHPKVLRPGGCMASMCRIRLAGVERRLSRSDHARRRRGRSGRGRWRATGGWIASSRPRRRRRWPPETRPRRRLRRARSRAGSSAIAWAPRQHWTQHRRRGRA